MANNSLYPDRTLHTKGYHGYSIQFSPFDANIFAVSAAENFGIRGSGCLIIFNLSAKFPIVRQFLYCDALFDLCWHKTNRGVILTGAGDGCIQIWSTNSSNEAPLTCRKVHSKEISSVSCCQFNSDYVATSSWDSSLTLCEVSSLLPVCTLHGHNGIAYEAAWSCVDDRVLASVSEDGVALLWSPFVSDKPSLALPSVGVELLSCDWSPSDPNLVATATTDAVIYGWDVRAPSSPLFRLHGHENAIRRVRFSPLICSELTSVSYDFTTRLWDTAYGLESSTSRSHSEFVYGVDYSMLEPGLVVDCSWDQKVQLYRVGPRLPITSGEGDCPSSSLQNHARMPSLVRPLPAPPPGVVLSNSPVARRSEVESSLLPRDFGILPRNRTEGVISRPLPPLPNLT